MFGSYDMLDECDRMSPVTEAVFFYMILYSIYYKDIQYSWYSPHVKDL